MKSVVQFGPVFDLGAGLQRQIKLGEDGLRLGEGLLRHQVDGVEQGIGFEQCPQIKELLDGRGIQHGHHGAAMGLELYQPLSFQLHQGFPHRDAAHRQLLGDGVLAQGGARSKLATQYPAAEVLHHHLGSGLVRWGHAGVTGRLQNCILYKVWLNLTRKGRQGKAWREPYAAHRPKKYRPAGLTGTGLRDARRVSYNCGPAATRRLPSSLSVKRSKFLMKRPARSAALASHSAWSA